MAMKHSMAPPHVLTIAGSDSSGSAGIQADLKTFVALGVHGLSAIAAVTAQNTRAIDAIHVVPARILRAQLDALARDFSIAAVKTGMLGSLANLRSVVAWRAEQGCKHLVVDPVLHATSGRRLLAGTALRALRDELLPLAEIVTPNIPEAEQLLGVRITNRDDARAAAHALLRFGSRAALLTGGHLHDTGRSVRDWYVDRRGEILQEHARLDFDARGTGCTLASAIAALLARGIARREAVRGAQAYLQACYRDAYSAGRARAHLLRHVRERYAARQLSADVR